MRQWRKALALSLACTLALTGFSAGIAPETGKAAVLSGSFSALKTEGEGTGNTESPAPGDETAGEVTGTESPAPGSEESAEETPATETTPAAIGTEAPAGAVTPSSITTPAAVEPATAGVIHAVGEKFTVTNFQYKVTVSPTDASKGQVKLVGLSDAAKTKKTLTVGATVSVDGYSYQITGIGTKAFKTSSALTTVTIGKNVTFVGIRAFQGVTTLTTVYLGAKVDTIKRRAFAGCSSLRRIVLTSKVKSIKKYAFANCRALKVVMITSKVLTEVGTKAFANNQTGRYFVIFSGKNTKYKKLITASGVASVKTYTF